MPTMSNVYIQRLTRPGFDLSDGTWELSTASCENIGLNTKKYMSSTEVRKALEAGETLQTPNHSFYLVREEPKTILPTVSFEKTESGYYRAIIFVYDPATGAKSVGDILEAKATAKGVLLDMLSSVLQDTLP
jgi:hypothetical protein